ncbi:MAG: hypothetical protein ACTHJT_14650 [Cytophaga sp.]|uniref:hypothetical protein n=1 Tax=Cytophaga sp. TaxID=29535 RepID=UPI003F7D7704
MQRTLLILFLLTLFSTSFWIIQFRNEGDIYKAFSSHKKTSVQQKLNFEEASWNSCDRHSFPSDEMTLTEDIPFEKEDKDEVGKETFTHVLFYYIQESVTNNLFCKKIVASYNRYFFKLHFSDIFSPPPNTNRA